MIITVAKYDLAKLVGSLTFIAAVVGGRACGKSTLIREVIEQCRPQYTKVVVFCSQRTLFEDVADSIYSIDMKNVAALEALIQTQKDTGYFLMEHLLIVIKIEDCSQHAQFLSSSRVLQKFLMYEGRFYKTSFIFSCPMLARIPQAIQRELEVGFWFKQPVADHEKVYHSFFWWHVPHFDAFTQVHDACTVGYECLVWTTLRQKVFFYRASDKFVAERILARLNVYREELASVCWHPSRLFRGCGETTFCDDAVLNTVHEREQYPQRWPGSKRA